jgi:hypothetical protein
MPNKNDAAKKELAFGEKTNHCGCRDFANSSKQLHYADCKKG